MDRGQSGNHFVVPKKSAFRKLSSIVNFETDEIAYNPVEHFDANRSRRSANYFPSADNSRIKFIAHCDKRLGQFITI
jgi:hypothetical protein